MPTNNSDLSKKIHAIDEWLPQTQCTQCSYPRCLDYAEAIAKGQADINQCPPGGDVTIRGLAALLGKIGKPLNKKFGIHKPREIAVIDESRCIGCVMCIKPCPTDAIVGAAKHLHTVIPEDCTGCGLCVDPCPVDCISMPTIESMLEQDSKHESITANTKKPQPHWRWDEYSPEQTERARTQTESKIVREKMRAKTITADKKLKAMRKSSDQDLKLDILAAVKRAQRTK
jgi:electron transport complex protein RnfB